MKDCRYDYIEKLNISEEAKDIVQKEHEQILREVDGNKTFFRKYGNFYVIKKYADRNKVNNFLATINNRYPKREGDGRVITAEFRHKKSVNLNIITINATRVLLPNKITTVNTGETLSKLSDTVNSQNFKINQEETLGLKDKQGNNIVLYQGAMNTQEVSFNSVKESNEYGPRIRRSQIDNSKVSDVSNNLQAMVVKNNTLVISYKNKKELLKHINSIYPDPTQVEINYFLHQSFKSGKIIRVGNEVLSDNNSNFVETTNFFEKEGDLMNYYEQVGGFNNQPGYFIYRGKEYSTYEDVVDAMRKDKTLITRCK